jgi:hypothetical protein
VDILAHIKEEGQLARLLSHMKAVREHWHSFVYMKSALEKKDSLMFREAWEELSTETQHALWVAPTKGGLFTTKERELMREYLA